MKEHKCKELQTYNDIFGNYKIQFRKGFKRWSLDEPEWIMWSGDESWLPLEDGDCFVVWYCPACGVKLT
jgi:hypothetical protein